MGQLQEGNYKRATTRTGMVRSINYKDRHRKKRFLNADLVRSTEFRGSWLGSVCLPDVLSASRLEFDR